MGLLDRVIKKKVSSVISSAVGGALGDALDNVLGKSDRAGEEKQTNTAYSTPSYSSPAQVRNDIRAMMPSILSEDFAAYEVQSGVSAAALGWGSAPAKPYDYVLYKNGAPVGAIMLTDKNRDRNAAFLNAKALCAQAGAPFINFYTDRPNQRDYVVGRIKGFLN